MAELRRNPNSLDVAAAARYLDLDEAAVRALAATGYLRAGADGSFLHADLKAFLARNADNGSGTLEALLRASGPPADLVDDASIDPDTLLAALDDRSDDMARRAFDIFSGVFTEAQTWSLGEQARFIEQARSRFEAILAVTSQGSEVDEALVGDLQEVGAAAAWSASPLPQLLAILRISRDLVVQTAVEVAEDRGRHWGLALSLLLTRVLPAMDRLTDAIAQGYWAAVVGREQEQRDRYEHVVETSSDGVVEVDLDGRIQYANPTLAAIVGRPPAALVDTPLSDAIHPADPAASVEPLMGDARSLLEILRPDGGRRVVEVRSSPRYRDGALVGYQSVVQDITARADLEADKHEFLALVTRDLRAPLATLLAQGSNLEAHAGELPPDQVARVGGAIRSHAERIARLADDLYDVSRMSSTPLALNTRPVDLGTVVRAALESVEGAAGVEVRVPAGIEVMADARRLEQVVANLVENGLIHGAQPVVVSAADAGDRRVVLSVADQGPGVARPLVPTLFSSLRRIARQERDGSRGSGLGLALVKGLAEAMGGTVDYERSGDVTLFRVSLPRPRHE